MDKAVYHGESTRGFLRLSPPVQFLFLASSRNLLEAGKSGDGSEGEEGATVSESVKYTCWYVPQKKLCQVKVKLSLPS